MYKGLDATSVQFLANLDRINERQARVQRQISSGLRVSQPSDAPDKVMDILQLRSAVERASAIAANLDRAEAEVATAESAISIAVNLVERARVLAAQGSTGTATNRPGIAIEARQLLDQLVHLTHTMSEGRYIFSGDLDQQRLYETDMTVPGGFVRLADAENTRMLQDVNGTQFSIAHSAHQIFDARNADGTFAEENVFNAVWTLADALERDDVAAVENSAQLLTAAVQHLGRETTFYGHAQNRVANARTLSSTVLNARKKELGAAQDTDIAEAIVELNLAGVHQQAALGAQAKMPRTSLFDYLA